MRHMLASWKVHHNGARPEHSSREQVVCFINHSGKIYLTLSGTSLPAGELHLGGLIAQGHEPRDQGLPVIGLLIIFATALVGNMPVGVSPPSATASSPVVALVSPRPTMIVPITTHVIYIDAIGSFDRLSAGSENIEGRRFYTNVAGCLQVARPPPPNPTCCYLKNDLRVMTVEGLDAFKGYWNQEISSCASTMVAQSRLTASSSGSPLWTASFAT